MNPISSAVSSTLLSSGNESAMQVAQLVEMAAESDVGLQRSNNEDSFVVVESSRLCVVADGMGGHLGGEVASSMVVKVLQEEFKQAPTEDDDADDIKKRLVTAIERANHQIYTRGNSDVRLRNMGTTVAAAVFHGQQIIYASVGDSRMYRLRGKDIEQVTEDHSWVGELRKKNLISADDARRHPLKNIITRALGMEATVLVDAAIARTKPGDLYLFCTDGLTDLVTDSEIHSLVTKTSANLAKAVRTLIDEANDLGGIDNCTVGLCRITAA